MHTAGIRTHPICRDGALKQTTEGFVRDYSAVNCSRFRFEHPGWRSVPATQHSCLQQLPPSANRLLRRGSSTQASTMASPPHAGPPKVGDTGDMTAAPANIEQVKARISSKHPGRPW